MVIRPIITIPRNPVKGIAISVKASRQGDSKLHGRYTGSFLRR
jgi:hypothetical protein